MKIVNIVQTFCKDVSFAVYCFPKGNDRRFVHEVKEIGNHPATVELEKFSEESDCKNSVVVRPVYHIVMEKSGSGFFADFNRLLMYLYFAGQYQLAPVIEFSREFSYAEDHQVNGTSNPFEYYFEQPTDISLNDMNGYTPVMCSRKDNTRLALELNDKTNGYERNELFLNAMAEVVKRYIRLNAITADKLKEDRKKIFGDAMDDVLGVHVRGTDFKQHYNGHPVMVAIEDYITQTEVLMSKGIYKRIFLATDDSDAVDRFKKKFGSDCVLCYDDVIRSNGTDTVMHSQLPRENHHYLLGLEVLRDMITLSECTGLVAGLSQVSFAARIFKKSYGCEYIDKVLLDKGIQYKNGKYTG